MCYTDKKKHPGTSTKSKYRLQRKRGTNACGRKKVCMLKYTCALYANKRKRKKEVHVRGDKCYTEKAEEGQQCPGIKTTINPAVDTRKKQCKHNITKPNQTPTRYTLVKGTIVLDIATAHAASSKSMRTCRTYKGMRHMHPVIRRAATQHLHTQSVTTRRRSGRTGKHEAQAPVSCQLTGTSASLPIKWTSKGPG